MRFILTDIDYSGGIRLFGETSSGERVVIKDESFKPYFYVNKKVVRKKVDDFEIIDVIKIDDKFKVVVNKPKAVRFFKELFKQEGLIASEFDIPFTQRYLIDKGLRILEGVDSKTLSRCDLKWEPRIMAIDIETTNKTGAPNTLVDEVLMISYWSNFGVKKVMLTKDCEVNGAESFKTEKDMLIAFNKLIIDSKPSIIVTYNGDMFDWPFLRDRMNKYKIGRYYGYDGSSMTIIKKRVGSSARIKGLANIDLYLFVSRIISSQLKTNSLDLGSVCQELIGVSKVDNDWGEFYSDWAKGKLDRIVNYSLVDAKITYELFDKLKPMIFEIAKLVNLPLYDASRSSYSSLVESYFINRAKEFGVIIPKLPSGSDVMARRSVSFTGGYVHQPKSGIYENIAVVDFRSLYPTIIVSYNISPETIGKKGLKVKVNGRTHEFSQDKKGFIPSVIEDLINKRAKLKKELKRKPNPILKAKSYAIKTITNAAYGYLSYPRSRWYCFECSESITALGRKHIKSVIDEAIKEGFGVCYGDTDSAFLLLGDKSKNDLKRFLKKINDSLPGIMELELERFCPRGLFVSGKKSDKGIKKRYVLLDEDGSLIIKGFEFVRGDWSDISRETQFKVFNALLKENNKEKAINEVKKTIKLLKENKIPLKELIIRTQLTRDIKDYKSIGPHVAVAKRLKEKGFPVEAGTIISYVVVNGDGLIRDKAKTIEEIKEGNLKPDADYYITHQVIPAIDKVLDAINVDEKTLNKKEQRGLKDFF